VAVADKTVSFAPFDGFAFSITGSENDAGVVGELERSQGRYQQDLALFLRRVLRPDAVAVDGGAHIGVFTVLMARLCPAGRVYAFEPAPESRAHLQANLTANGVANASVEAAALYDAAGEVSFDFNVSYPAGAHVSETGSGVTAVSLDTWAGKDGIGRLDLVKLDIEGAELAALRGAQAVIRRFGPVTVVECNPVALRRFGGHSYGELLELMRSLFPFVGAVGGGGGVVPVLSEEHLQLLLGEGGVVDLVGLPGPGWLRSLLPRGQAVTELLRLRRAHNRHRPPIENLIVDPDVDIHCDADRVAGQPGGTVSVPVVVTNRSRWWLSSAFPYQPVHLAYRWLDERGSMVVPEGHRTPFPEPLAPGGRAAVDVVVQLPASPGDYELMVTIVQESFAWLDELDPRVAARVQATVS
jgi:FkbM family methyltransferase